MKINRLVIKGLYGYINKDIKFNSSLNLLVGINGSGKTSVLNVMSWIVNRKFNYLCATEFNEIILYFSYKEKNCQIKCKHAKKILTISIKIGAKSFAPITITLEQSPSINTTDRVIREHNIDFYDSLAPEQHEMEAWSFFDEINKPIIIGLDRTLYTEEEDSRVYFDKDGMGGTVKRRLPKSNKSISPVSRVKELMQNQYTSYRSDVIRLNKDLQNKIILSAFDKNFIRSDSFSKPIKITKNEITKLEARVISHLAFGNKKDESTDAFIAEIKEYFTKFRDLLVTSNDSPDARIETILNASQFIRTKTLINEFENHEKKLTAAYDDIRVFLEELNKYYKDSYKELVFSEENNKIFFDVIDKEGIRKNRLCDIETLSSGEQQILILFAYVAFNAKESSVFIIDEPEISLHPKWQEEFMGTIERIMPDSMQFIIATHSPAIVGKRIKQCKVLLPYNS